MDTDTLVEYLGDGAYVSVEQGHVVLTAGHHEPSHAPDAVYLDEEAEEALQRWLAKRRDHKEALTNPRILMLNKHLRHTVDYLRLPHSDPARVDDGFVADLLEYMLDNPTLSSTDEFFSARYDVDHPLVHQWKARKVGR